MGTGWMGTAGLDGDGLDGDSLGANASGRQPIEASEKVGNLDSAALDREIFSAFQRSVLWLRETFGDNPADWQWKNVHKVSFRPPLFAEAADQEGASTLLKLMVRNLLTIGPYEAEGNAITVNNTEYDWRNPYDVTIGASVRRVVDFGETDAGGTNSGGTISGGTSPVGRSPVGRTPANRPCR